MSWDYTWKQKMFSISQGSTSWYHDMTDWQTITFETTHENKGCSACPKDQHYAFDIMTWQNDKQSLLILDIITKVVQHVPRITIKHLTYMYDKWHHHFLVPSFCHFDIFYVLCRWFMVTDIFLHYSLLFVKFCDLKQ